MLKYLLSWTTCTVLWLGGLGHGLADDWPQWLGPRRDSVWRESGILKKFPALSGRLRQVLEDAGLRLPPSDPADLRSGIVYAEADVDAVRLRNELLARGVYVSARGDGIRCSAHFYNDETDLERLREALDSLP